LLVAHRNNFLVSTPIEASGATGSPARFALKLLAN